MIKFSATLEKFGQMGEKTGWTYILIPQKTAEKLSPGKKTSYRVKGKLDNHTIEKVAMVPFGGGDFIIAINAGMRKALMKKHGDKIKVELELDSDIVICAELLECLQDEPVAKAYFSKLAPSHQRYYSRWIESAKTDQTKTKRIAQAVNAFSLKLSYGEMIRMNKEKGI